VDHVDVSNADELVAAINAFEGQVLVFDGHGAHRDKEAAALYLQDEPINVWTLRDRITRMPPIVLLSACDTHAADRNHATVGNGFLALGARAVLASVFPLFAPTAATFIARLLYRIWTSARAVTRQSMASTKTPLPRSSRCTKRVESRGSTSIACSN
jgi:hypothetical protein